MFSTKTFGVSKYLKSEILNNFIHVHHLSTSIQSVTLNGIVKNVKEKLKNFKKETQQYAAQRKEILGSDLAAAHFLIYYGGKVKFKNIDEWVSFENKSTHLPSAYDPNYILVEIDASNIELYYENLQVFKDIDYLKRATFAGCPSFDDWFVDKISTLIPNLEYLDISNCSKVTERALLALYRSENLKTVVITNHLRSIEFEITAAMLQDCKPGLTVHVDVPKKKNNV